MIKSRLSRHPGFLGTLQNPELIGFSQFRDWESPNPSRKRSEWTLSDPSRGPFSVILITFGHFSVLFVTFWSSSDTFGHSPLAWVGVLAKVEESQEAHFRHFYQLLREVLSLGRHFGTSERINYTFFVILDFRNAQILDAHTGTLTGVAESAVLSLFLFSSLFVNLVFPDSDPG